MEELYPLSEKESKRFSDLKFVGIILIVLIHMSSDAGMESVADFIIYIFSQIIARSAVPVFFMLSGILLYRKQFKWKENIKKKIKTLVIPFVFWNTLWLVVFWMAQKIPSLDFLFKNPMNRVGDFSIFDWIDAYLAIFQRTKPFVYPLWFIKDLLILNCFAPLIKNIVDRIPKGILVILFALYLCRVNLRFIEIQSIVWFTFGYYIVKYNIRIETIQSKVKKSAVAGYIVVVLCLAFAEFHYQRNIYIVHELVIIYGVVMMISEIDIADRLHNEKALHIWKNCVSGTFFVFCAHEWTLLFVRKIIQKVLPNNQILDVLCFFLVPIFVIAALLFIAEMMKRRMPELYRIIVGSRNQEKYNDYETRKYENYKKWGGAYSLAGFIKGNLYAVYYGRSLYIFS